MVNPVPGYAISTSYGKTGPWWRACGWHTGVDIAAPLGTKVVAARAGRVVHTQYGSAFGNRQFSIRCSDGTEDFYAHTDTRPPNGVRVTTGQKVAVIGSRGLTTGPHLHFERHSVQGTWSCGVMRNPRASIEAEEDMSGDVYLSKLKYGQRSSDSVRRLQDALNGHPLKGGSTMPMTGNYLDQTDKEVRLCQAQHGFGLDPVGKSFVGPRQAEHLFSGTGYTVIDDVTPQPPPVEPPPVEPPPEVTVPGFIYRYSKKPPGTQKIGTKYQKVDWSEFTPPGDGFLLSMLYINAAFSLKAGVDSAGFRVRAVRAAHGSKPVDLTGYQDYTPNRNMANGSEFLATHLWFEKCDGNRQVHWEVDRDTAFASFDLGTRYTKWVWISKDVFALVERLLGSEQKAAEALAEFFTMDEDDGDSTVLEPEELALGEDS